MMAEIAARNITAPDLARLAANIAEMESAIAQIEAKEIFDVDDFVGLDREFHEILARPRAIAC